MEFKAFLVFLLLGFAMTAIVECNLEGDILHAQKTAWKDPNNVLASWDPTLINPCTWFHVTCNSDNSVIRVDLGNANLSGPLISQLGSLKNLQYLELQENKITGEIPTTLGSLTKLVSLDLYKNKLTGRIPSSLGNIMSLRDLRLNQNQLTGTLPASIVQLAISGSLNLVNVSGNKLTGTITSSPKRVTLIVQDPKI